MPVSLNLDCCASNSFAATLSLLLLISQKRCVRIEGCTQQRRKLISDVEDHIGDLHNWPFKEQLFVLNVDAPSRGSVFRFHLLALGNRVPPLLFATMLIGLGKLRTSKKRRDAWDAMRAFRDGGLRLHAFYWDMEAGQRV